MKNLKKGIIIAVIVLVIAIIGGLGFYFYKKANTLTIDEKKWLDGASASSQVVNINVVNNVSVLGYSGKGVFFDFLNDFKNKYSLNINPVTYDAGTPQAGVTLGSKTTLDDKDVLFYTDHYVLVTTEKDIISSPSMIKDKTVGILAKDLSYVSKYLENSNITFKSYDDYNALNEAMGENKYAILPLLEYLDQILSGNYRIAYHFSDINVYYVLTPAPDDLFSSSLIKFFATWQDKIEEYYNKELFNLITSKMNITDTEIDAMRSVSYTYGFINNSPYDLESASSYGGISAVYLKKFASFAGLDIAYEKYGSINKLNKAIGKGKVDIFLDYFNITSDFTKTESGLNIKYSIVANKKNNVVMSSVNSLIGKTVYVQDKTQLHTYLSSIPGIDIKTYDDKKDLLKLNKKDVIIFMDSNAFEYYAGHGLSNYSARYSGSLNTLYNYNTSNKSGMYKLFNKYLEITDSNSILYDGMYNHEVASSSGLILGTLAKYIIILLIILLVIIYIIIKKTHKITIAKKIKKEDKLRFIDQLTLLKNRNYLNENIENWNKNTVYPQAVIVLDLNNIQEINDIDGYEEGDKQIQAAANALIKTQLDNSEIIRTDGNEFVIYLVGYSQKQITNYIHKLNKEFKKLPHDYGAEFGYSLIIDDITTIEDALNEATKSLKEQKESHEAKDDK